jgi:hypothetical protein
MVVCAGAGFLFFCLAREGAQAHRAVPLNYICEKAESPISIDGLAQEWQDVQPIALASGEYWRPAPGGRESYGGAADAALRLRAVWTSENLYLLAELYDDHFEPPPSGSKAWLGDAVVLAFDPLNDGSTGYGDDDQELVIVPRRSGAPVVWRWHPKQRAGPVVGARAAVSKEYRREAKKTAPPIKLTFEVSIEWAELAPFQALPGRRIGFNFAAIDYDEGQWKGCLSWAPGIAGLKDPSRFGNIVLVEP